jgi:transcriptional regulator with XRE-family HTH domain
MDGFGERLRHRARELGLSVSELARRAGIESSKFGKYVRNTHEPDLTTLLQICGALDVTPNDLLLPTAREVPTERQLLLSRISGACAALSDDELKIVAKMVANATTSSDRA